MMPRHDLATDGQSHSRPFVFRSAVQSLEHLKNPFQIGFVKSDAVVGDGDLIAVDGARGSLSSSRPVDSGCDVT